MSDRPLTRPSLLESTSDTQTLLAAADFWLVVLALGFGSIYLLLVGVFWLVTTCWVPLLLAYIVSILWFALHFEQRVAPKVRRTASSDLCWLREDSYAVVLGVRDYLDLTTGKPLGTYCTIKTEGSYLVDVVVPKLDAAGGLLLKCSVRLLNEVSLAEETETSEYHTLKPLAPVLQEYYRLEDEIAALHTQQAEIDRLTALLASSELYTGEVETYRRAHVGLDALLERTEALKTLYLSLVREGLIAQQVQRFAPEQLPTGAPVSLYSRYQEARAEFEQMKETARAYSQLLHDRQA